MIIIKISILFKIETLNLILDQLFLFIEPNERFVHLISRQEPITQKKFKLTLKSSDEKIIFVKISFSE